MDRILVKGGCTLRGTLPISGAKNAALPIMPIAILTDEPVVIGNLPDNRDIFHMLFLLEQLGVKAVRSGVYTDEEASKNCSVKLDASNLTSHIADYDTVRKMRASVLVIAPLVARLGKASVSLPGGCAIGNRPVDMHIYALRCLGAEIEIEHGYINASAPNGLKGGDIHFDKISVGATETAILGAVLAKGTTVIHNAALEPEIVDLVHALRAMGAEIEGEGSSVITIRGVDKLHGARHQLIPDRIETGTYAIAAAVTGGELYLKYANINHIQAPMQYLRKCNVEVIEKDDGILVKAHNTLVPLNLQTQPFPNFPTDLQSPMMVLLCQANGISSIEETIFESRFMHVPELVRMGANITVQGHTAVIQGRCQFQGASVMATDLRASVALILAGLAAPDGEETMVNRVYHLDRGYENITGKLQNCGAYIERVTA